MRIDGIGEKKALKIHKSYIQENGTRKIVAALLPFGITPNLAHKLYKKWGILAVDKIKKNPYLMADPISGIDGIGFKKADEIAMKLKIDKHSPLRLQSLIVYLLTRGSMDGNIYYTFEELLRIGEKAELLNGITADEVQENLDILKKEERIFIEGNRIYAIGHYYKELYNARKLVVLHEAETKPCVFDIDRISKKLGNIEYDEGQRKAIETASLDTTGVMILTGGPGTGKAQPLDSKVLTPNGFVQMGDVKVGDKVISGTGNVSTVLGVYPQGKKPIYELTFDDGSTCKCSDEHLWTVQTFEDRLSYTSKENDRGQKERTIELKEMLKDFKLAQGRSKYSIQYVKPVDFKEKDFYIHPYLLGLLIGDGCLTEEGNSISLQDEQLRKDIYNFFPNSDYELSLKSQSHPEIHDYSIKYKGKERMSISNHPNMTPLTYYLQELGLRNKHSYEKFIPQEYLYASQEQRRWLLKGLLDTDGSPTSTSIEYSTTSKQLRDDMIELVHSLGGYASFSVRMGRYNKNGEHFETRENYRIRIQFSSDNNDCFNLERKRNIYKPQRPKDSFKRFIKDIQYIGEEDCQCIYIDDPSHLYITDNYIITHNTTVTKGIIEMLKESKYEILCAAPTGRAAKRMYEATGCKASTIHRLLGAKGVDNAFEHNEKNPLICDALIIDEASMIDNNLMYSLLLAIQEGTKLIMIGDIDQLPSIGAGNILRDMIASKLFPVEHLKKIHRQGAGSLIIDNAHAINEGRNIKIKNTENTDCIFMDIEKYKDDSEVIDKIVSLVSKEIPEKYGYDPRDIKILAPMKKSTLGTNEINKRLQEKLKISKKSVSYGATTFFVGDKVMQIKNNSMKNVFNGDIGIITFIDKVEKEVTVRYPNDDPVSLEEYIDVIYDFHELDEIVLAYATTIHKSQGSEYPAMIMVVSYKHYVMLQRNLIYTGITRAKKLCFILGTEKAIYHASNTVPAIHRNTSLIDRMYEFINEDAEEE